MTAQENKPKSRGRVIAAFILIICAVVILLFTIRFVRHRMAYAVTDAVFVQTDSLVSVGFNRVSGRISVINKKEGDRVRKGEVLARLDDTSYRLAVEELGARLEAARKSRQAKDFFLQRLKKETRLNEEIAASRLTELEKRKEAMSSTYDAAQVEIEQLKRDNKRYQDLLPTKSVSHSQAEDIAARLLTKQLSQKSLLQQIAALDASVVTSRHQVELANVQKLHIKEAAKDLASIDEQIKEINASLKMALDDLEQCVIKSPLNGRVAKRFVSSGALVSPQSVVFSLLDPQDIYIVVLLEEQKLAGVLPGSTAYITIDAYPKYTYEGRVESILPASAATFALAPRDISAGEFTKVAQRIPVRIKISKGDISRLRVGMGGEVEIKRQNNPRSASENQ
jgi:membrane fusion protein (multidrug efflux system)